jgi:hypothetical protein
MGKYGIWIFILIIAVRAISAVLQRREKERRKQQQVAAGSQQRPIDASGSPTPAQASRSTEAVQGKSQILLEKRRQQLEQLRQRRGATASAQRPEQPAVLQPPQPRQTKRDPVTFGSPAQLPPTRRPSQGSQPASGPSGRPQRQKAQREKEKAEKFHAARIESPAPAIQPPPRQVEPAKPAATATTRATDAAVRLRQTLADPRSLRELVWMREILDPPLSLR